MDQPLRVLVIEDSEDDTLLIIRQLQRGGYNPIYERIDTPEAMHAALERYHWDLVLADFRMPHFNALDALRLIQERGMDIPFIIISGSIGEETAVAAMKAGAHDYLMKDNLARLVPAVERELREAEGRRERKRLEQQLLQAQKLESIGRLAGGIAHDFNNLLTVIYGYADLLEMQLQGTPALKSLQHMREAAERAAGLTRQLLTFARRQAIQPKIVNLNEIVLGVATLLRRLIGEDIELVIVTTEEAAVVHIDIGQMEQVLVNLAVNARDAMPNGGKLSIEVANMTLDEEYARHHLGILPGEYVMLAVGDTGIGMDKTVQEHIFEPFFTTKEAGKGTGLGLATCYGIVKQSGGHIWLYSEPGQGTTFKIYLPRVEETIVSASRQECSQFLPHGTETILLVEDESLVRGTSVQTLRMLGYTVLEAANGSEALRVAQNNPGQVDLLVTDMVMPQMGGGELVHEMRALYPRLRALFISGYTHETADRLGLLGTGASFLQKPFSPAMLARKVREVLDAEPG